ncbi:MAG: PrsW family glutamic-type intramembrane protease [Thermoplasmata archaeon]|nr:PrsW family glutamic-type intramembrane protease [Thermoplasmata archaeon]
MNAIYLGGLIGFGPALFLIWFSLRKYTYPFVEGSLFEDRKVFFLLAVGMFAGTFVYILEQFLTPLYSHEDSISLMMFILVFVLAFPLIEDLVKFVILNFKGYEGRFDSTFYGISLGAGFSATWIIGYVIRIMNDAEVSGDSVSPEGWLGLILFSICVSLIHCSVGAILGDGTGKKMGLKGLPGAVIPHFIFNLLLFPFLVYGQIWYSLVFLIPVSALIYHGVYTHTIPECLPQEVQKEIRRNQRRRQ